MVVTGAEVNPTCLQFMAVVGLGSHGSNGGGQAPTAPVGIQEVFNRLEFSHVGLL